MPEVGAPEYNEWLKKVREFGKAIWAYTGKGNNVDMVFEHPGEATFPVSVMVVKRGGMVVICAGTTGFDAMVDLRYHWTRQKRFQGSHGTNDSQAHAYNDLVRNGKIDPVVGRTMSFLDVPLSHAQMGRGEEVFGNTVHLVGARTPDEGRR